MTKISYMSEMDFHKQAKEADFDSSGTILRKQFIPDEIKAINEDKRLVDFVISTDSVDRYGDTVSVKGWSLKAFKRNPVVLFAHDSWSPPIAKASRVRVEDGKLKARAEFMGKDLNPFADSIFQMYVQGFMKATSVGFMPIKYNWSEDEKRSGGIDFEEQELLEFSAVPVPANPEALIEAREAGIDTLPLKHWAESILDRWEEAEDTGLLVPRKTVEALGRLADPKSLAYFRLPVEERNKILLEKNLGAIRTQEAEEAEKEEVETMPKNEDDNVTKEIGDLPEEKEEKGASDFREADEGSAEIELDDDFIESLKDKAEKAILESLFGKDVNDDEPEFDQGDESDSHEDVEDALKDLLENTDLVLEGFEEGVTKIAETRQGRRLLRNLADNLSSLSDNIVKFLGEEKSEEASDPEPEKAIEDVAEKKEAPASHDDNTHAEKKFYDPQDIADVAKELIPGYIQSIVQKTMKQQRGQLD